MSIIFHGRTTLAKLRKSLGLTRNGKALIREDNGKIIVEPTSDIFELAGSLKKYAIKGKPIEEVMKLEEQAIEKAIVEDYKLKLVK